MFAPNLNLSDLDTTPHDTPDLSCLPPCRLEMNWLGPEGAKALAPALAANSSLTSIDLSNNSLVKLDEWFCDVKGPGCLNGGPRRWHCSNDCDWDACDVCHLAQHGHQHELELIDAFVGINALGDALLVNVSLRALDVSCNELGKDGKALLRQAVQGRSGFDLKTERI